MIKCKHCPCCGSILDKWVEDPAKTNDSNSEYLQLHVDTLKLSTRVKNVLKTLNIQFIHELVIIEFGYFRYHKLLGFRSLFEIKEALNKLGLSFGMDLSA